MRDYAFGIVRVLHGHDWNVTVSLSLFQPLRRKRDQFSIWSSALSNSCTCNKWRRFLSFLSILSPFRLVRLLTLVHSTFPVSTTSEWGGDISIPSGSSSSSSHSLNCLIILSVTSVLTSWTAITISFNRIEKRLDPRRFVLNSSSNLSLVCLCLCAGGWGNRKNKTKQNKK